MSFDDEINEVIAQSDGRTFPDPLSVQSRCGANLFLSHLATFLMFLTRPGDQEPKFTHWINCLNHAQNVLFVESQELSLVGLEQLRNLLSDVGEMCRKEGEFSANSGDIYQARQFAWRVAGCTLFLRHA